MAAVDEQRCDTLMAEARALVSERRWQDAAARFAKVATQLGSAGLDVRAEEAFAAGGDAAWRADLPDLAMRCLVRSRERLPKGSRLRAVRAVQMAGVLIELGELDSAGLLLDEALEGEPARELVMVALDTRIAIDLLQGQVGRAHNRLVELESLVGEESAPVLLFRQGQLAARLGRFSEAVESLAACVALIEARPAYDGPRGAALLELAEVACFREEHDDALALLEAAADAWEHAGRRSGMMRVEAARMRLLGLMGAVETLTSGLERSLRFARERDLRLLEAELRLANGICEAVRSPQRSAVQLDRAIELAGNIGAHALRGRALLARHDHPDGEREALERACLDLLEVPTWRSRAFLALARALGDSPADRDDALEMCATALCRFSAMGLPADEAKARGLLWRLSTRK
jgi:tetratricopeptide (TPR) repeat protein